MKGEGNQQDYGMRVYDPRIGKFLSVDPLTKDYPFFSPYHFAGNSPLENIDLDGGEPKSAISQWKWMGLKDGDNNTIFWGGKGFIERSYDPYITTDFRAAYDWVTKQVWFVHKDPTTQQWYYWKHNEGANTSRLTYNPSDPQKDNGQWTAFTPYNPAQDRTFDYIMTGILLTPAGILLGEIGSAISAAPAIAEGVAIDALLLYWRYAPIAGTVGMKVAEFLDETGSVGLSQGQRVIFNKTAKLAENAGHIFSNDHVKKGILKLGNSREEILDRIGSVIEQNLGKLQEGPNTIVTEINNVTTTIRAEVINGEVSSVNAFTGTSQRKTANLIDLTKKP